MKKALIIFSTVCLAVVMSGLTALAQDEPVESEDPGINTGLIRSDAGGAAPIVKVKWEMWDWGKDDCDSPGAQFKPSGKYQVNTSIKVCAVVTDPDGLADITSGGGAVYSDIYYPTDIDTGPSHKTSLEGTPAGCGKLLGTECQMTQLSKADGLKLFCDKIRNDNNNLPKFYDGYDYPEICKDDGELMKETAAVFCCDKTLSYEDPSGEYKTLVFAQDKAGKDSNYLENNFRYLPVAAFETDFNAVNYDSVKLNTHKIINGDNAWNTPLGANPATIRNTGNTRIEVSVKQDDMGLGMTGTSWNVKYDGRIGSDAAFRSYDPETWQALDKYLNLSAKDEMDFSIDIFKFPPFHPDKYIGHMSLKAHNVAHLVCVR